MGKYIWKQFARAFAGTKSFMGWKMTTLLRSFILWGGSAYFLYHFGHLDELDKKIALTISGIAGLVISVIGVFLWNLFFAPLWIDKEQEDAISGLDAEIKKLKEQKLHLSFSNDFAVVESIVDGKKRNANWLRVRLENTGITSVTQCEPRLINLTRVENGEEQGCGFKDRLQLQWAGINSECLAKNIVGKDVINIAVVNAYHKQWRGILSLATCHNAFYLRDLFVNHGIYRFRIQVLGHEARSNILVLDINWMGKWDTFSASTANASV